MRSPLRALATLVNRGPVPYVSKGTRLALPWSNASGPEAQMRAMGSVGTLFAIVSRLAEATSQVEWKLWRQAPSGLDEDRVEITDPNHPVLKLWNKPNDFMTGQEFRAASQQHLDLTGEGWWHAVRHESAPSLGPFELWPIRPDRMVPNPDPEKFILNFTYLSPDGQQIPLELDEVIQLKMPNPLDPYRGMGPVQSILTHLDTVKYTAEWNRNFFRNSAEPGGIIEIPDILSDPDFEKLRTRWDEQHKGVANAHRVALLERGKWVNRTFTMRDMQFAELAEVGREIIREAFAFPKPLLGTVEDVNRANAEAAELVFARWLIVTRLQRMKQAANVRLLPMFGLSARNLVLDFVSPVPEDREADNAELTARSTAAKELVTVGFHEDDVCDAVGLPRMRFSAPAAAAPVARPLAPAARLPREGGRQAITMNITAPDLDADLRDVIARQLGRGPRNATATEEREAWQARLEDLLADWEQVSEDQRAELATQIQDLVEAGDPAALAGLTVSSDAAADLLQAAMEGQAADATQAVVEDAESQGVAIATVAIAGVLAADLAAASTVTAALLAAGLAAAAAREALRAWAPGMTGTEVAGRVTAFLEGLGDRTLRTELGGAIWSAEGMGRVATFRQAIADGLAPTKYVADETRDGNTCEACRDIADEQFTTLEDALEAYPTGAGHYLCAGGVRCRGEFYAVWEAA